jgi:uncharacterized protein with GYD domain
MTRYLCHATYTAEGMKGLLAEGGSRRKEAVEKLMASVGGKLEAFYYALGDTDLYCLVSFPDNASAAAISLIVGAAGGATAKFTVLLTPEEIDAAVKKNPSYRPPGR